MTKAGIIVVSDKCYANTRQDTAGEAIREILNVKGYDVIDKVVVADEVTMISGAIIALCKRGANLVITTGGTGLSKRDVTPEATKVVLEKEVPGISEAIRAKSMEKTDRAMLSRGISGIRGDALIINLPGSEKAVRESLDIIMNALNHGIEILTGTKTECAR